jgi:hypothetical protein
MTKTPALLAAFVVSSSAFSGACETDLGTCDETEALRPVWDDFGAPAYEGQAMLEQSCGFGAFCHSEDVPDRQRFGVPRGLEWDLRVIASDDTVDLEATDRLRHMHERTFRDRDQIWRAVSSGRMPIGGAAGRDLVESAPAYFRRDANGALTPIARIDTAEGREIFRNWLACGVPIVERSVPARGAQGYVPVGHVVSEAETEPLMPAWGDIYERLVEKRCSNAVCHGDARAGELGLLAEADALTALVNVLPEGEDCVGNEHPFIVPGDPDASLLVHKLEGRDETGAPVCGHIMPIGGSRVSAASIDAIRTWIAAGAMPD